MEKETGENGKLNGKEEYSLTKEKNVCSYKELLDRVILVNWHSLCSIIERIPEGCERRHAEMQYDFNKPIDRWDNNAVKYDEMEQIGRASCRERV